MRDLAMCFEWEQGSVRSFIHCAARKLEAELMAEAESAYRDVDR